MALLPLPLPQLHHFLIKRMNDMAGNWESAELLLTLSLCFLIFSHLRCFGRTEPLTVLSPCRSPCGSPDWTMFQGRWRLKSWLKLFRLSVMVQSFCVWGLGRRKSGTPHFHMSAIQQRSLRKSIYRIITKHQRYFKKTYPAWWSMSVWTLESWSVDSRAFWWILISRSSLCLFSVSCSCCLRASLRAFSCCCNTNSDLSPSSSQGSSFDIFLWPVKQTQKTWAERKKIYFFFLFWLNKEKRFFYSWQAKT